MTDERTVGAKPTPKAPPSHPTVRDVARLAGVGQSTASRALSGKGYVSPAARAAVVRAAETLGYVPNDVARSLRSRATRAIGVLISGLANPFYAEVASAIEHELRSLGYQMLLADSDGIPEEQSAALRTFQSMRVDGIILTPSEPAPALEALLDRGVPIVQVDRVAPGISSDAVLVDNEAGALDATRHLIALGHRRIGIVVGKAENAPSSGRLSGYRRALEESAIAVDDSFVAYSSFHPVDAFRSVDRLLEAHPEITALFATNNSLAQGAFRAASAKRLRIPEDLSLIAFDDHAWMTLASPAVTTVAQPTEQMGREAAKLVFARLAGHLPQPPVVRTLPTSLQVRDSTAQPRQTPHESAIP